MLDSIALFESDRLQKQDEYATAQKKTFTKWVNVQLGKVNMSIDDLYTGLQDGVKLIKLVEVIANVRLSKPNKGKILVQKIENVNIALKFLKTKVVLLNISAEDIVDGNKRLTLGLIWTLIARFQIQELKLMPEETQENTSVKEALLLWCKRKTRGYQDVSINDFSKSWRDGLAFGALIHSEAPNLYDFEVIRQTKKPVENMNMVFETAEKNLGIPRLLDAEDIDVPNPDEKSILTYISSVYHTFTRIKTENTCARRIGKIIDQAKNVQDMINKYEMLTEILLAWIQQKSSEFQSNLGQKLSNRLNEICDSCQVISIFRSKVKPEKFEALSQLDELLFKIHSQQKVLKHALYIPRVENQRLNFINNSWQKMESLEVQYDNKLKDQLVKLEKLEAEANLFNKQAELRKNWLSDSQLVYENIKNDLFNDLDSRKEAKLTGILAKKVNAFVVTIEAKNDQFNEINVKGNNLINSNYWNSLEIESRCNQLMTSWRNFKNEKIPELQVLSKALVKHNDVFQELERNSMDLLELTNRLTNPTKGELINIDTSALVLSPTASSVLGSFSEPPDTSSLSSSLSGEQIIKAALDRHLLAQKELSSLKNRILINCENMENFWKDLSTKNSAYFSNQLKERDLKLVSSIQDELTEVSEATCQRHASLECQLNTMDLIDQLTSHLNSLTEQLNSLEKSPVKPIEMARNITTLHREVKRHKMQLNEYHALKLETNRLKKDVDSFLRSLSDNRDLIAAHRKKITSTIQGYFNDIEKKESSLEETLEQKAKLIHDCQESAVFYSEVVDCIDWINDKKKIVANIDLQQDVNLLQEKSPLRNFQPLLQYGVNQSNTKALITRQEILKRELSTFENDDVNRLSNIVKLLTQSSDQHSMSPYNLKNAKFNAPRIAVPFSVRCYLPPAQEKANLSTLQADNTSLNNLIESRVIAIHDYQARDDRKRDISLKTGELLVLIHKSNDEWWRVRKLNKASQDAWYQVQTMYETAHETNLSSEDLKSRQATIMYGHEGFAPANFLKEVATGNNGYKTIPKKSNKRTPLQSLMKSSENENFVPSIRSPDNLHFDKENIRKEFSHLQTAFKSLKEDVETRDQNLHNTLAFHEFFLESDFLSNWLDIQMGRLEGIQAEPNKNSSENSNVTTDIARISPRVELLKVLSNNIPSNSLFAAKKNEIYDAILKKWNKLNELKNSLSAILVNDHEAIVNSIESINMLIDDRLAKLNAIRGDSGNEVVSCSNYIRAHKNMEIEMNVAKQKCDEVVYLARGYEKNAKVQERISKLKEKYQLFEDEMKARGQLLDQVLKRLKLRDSLDEFSSQVYMLEDDFSKFEANIFTNLNGSRNKTKAPNQIKRRNSSISRATRYTLTNINSVENLLTSQGNIGKLEEQIKEAYASLKNTECQVDDVLQDESLKDFHQTLKDQHCSNKERLEKLEKTVNEKNKFISQLLAAQGLFKTLNVISNSFENTMKRLDFETKLSSLSDVNRERNQLTNIKYTMVKDLDSLEEIRNQISNAGFIGVTNNELTEQCSKVSSLASECQERIRIAESYINSADERIQTKMLINELEDTLADKTNDLTVINTQLEAIDKEVAVNAFNQDLSTRQTIEQKYLDQIYRKILRLNEIKEESKRNQLHLSKIDIKNPLMKDSRKMTCNPEKLTLMLARLNMDWVHFDEKIDNCLSKAEKIKEDLFVVKQCLGCQEKLAHIQGMIQHPVHMANLEDQNPENDMAIRGRLSQNKKLSKDCNSLQKDIDELTSRVKTVSNQNTSKNINNEIELMLQTMGLEMSKISQNSAMLTSSVDAISNNQVGTDQLAWIKERNKKLLRMNSFSEDAFNPLEITNQGEFSLYEKKLKTLLIEANLREAQINRIIESTKGSMVSEEIAKEWKNLQDNLNSYLAHLNAIRRVIEVRQTLIDLHSHITEKQLAMYALLNRAEKSVNIEPKRIEGRLNAVKNDLESLKTDINSAMKQAENCITDNSRDNLVSKVLIKSLSEHNQLLSQIFSQTLSYLDNSISQLGLLSETNNLIDKTEEQEAKFTKVMTKIENIQNDMHMKILEFDPSEWDQSEINARNLVKENENLRTTLKEAIARITNSMSKNSTEMAKNQSAAFTCILEEKLEELISHLDSVDSNKTALKKTLNLTSKNVSETLFKRELLQNFINLNCQLEDQISEMNADNLRSSPKDESALENKTKDHLRREALSVSLQQKYKTYCQKFYTLDKLDQDDLLLSFEKMQLNWKTFTNVLQRNREIFKHQEQDLRFKQNSSRLLLWANETLINVKNIELDCIRAKEIYQNNMSNKAGESRRLIDPKVIDDWRQRIEEIKTVEIPLWKGRLETLVQNSEELCEDENSDTATIQQKVDLMVNQLRTTTDSIDKSKMLLDQISSLVVLQRDFDLLNSAQFNQIEAKLTNITATLNQGPYDYVDVDHSINQLTDIKRQNNLAKKKVDEIVKLASGIDVSSHFAKNEIVSDIDRVRGRLDTFDCKISQLSKEYEEAKIKLVWRDEVADLNTWIQQEIGYLRCNLTDKIELNDNLSAIDISRQIDHFKRQEKIFLEVEAKGEKYEDLCNTYHAKANLLKDYSGEMNKLKKNWQLIRDELLKLSPNISYYSSLFSFQDLVENLDKWILEKKTLVANEKINFDDSEHLKYLIETINQPVCGKQVTNEVIKEFISEADQICEKLSKEPSSKINLDHDQTKVYISKIKDEIENKWAALKYDLDIFRERLETACLLNDSRDMLKTLIFQADTKLNEALSQITLTGTQNDLVSVELALRKTFSFKNDESVLKQKFNDFKTKLEADIEKIKNRPVNKTLTDQIVAEVETLENLLVKFSATNQDGYLLFSRKLSSLKILDSCDYIKSWCDMVKIDLANNTRPEFLLSPIDQVDFGSQHLHDILVWLKDKNMTLNRTSVKLSEYENELSNRKNLVLLDYTRKAEVLSKELPDSQRIASNYSKQVEDSLAQLNIQMNSNIANVTDVCYKTDEALKVAKTTLAIQQDRIKFFNSVISARTWLEAILLQLNNIEKILNNEEYQSVEKSFLIKAIKSAVSDDKLMDNIKTSFAHLEEKHTSNNYRDNYTPQQFGKDAKLFEFINEKCASTNQEAENKSVLIDCIKTREGVIKKIDDIEQILTSRIKHIKCELEEFGEQQASDQEKSLDSGMALTSPISEVKSSFDFSTSQKSVDPHRITQLRQELANRQTEKAKISAEMNRIKEVIQKSILAKRQSLGVDSNLDSRLDKINSDISSIEDMIDEKYDKIQFNSVVYESTRKLENFINQVDAVETKLSSGQIIETSSIHDLQKEQERNKESLDEINNILQPQFTRLSDDIAKELASMNKTNAEMSNYASYKIFSHLKDSINHKIYQELPAKARQRNFTTSIQLGFQLLQTQCQNDLEWAKKWLNSSEFDAKLMSDVLPMKKQLDNETAGRLRRHLRSMTEYSVQLQSRLTKTKGILKELRCVAEVNTDTTNENKTADSISEKEARYSIITSLQLNEKAETIHRHMTSVFLQLDSKILIEIEDSHDWLNRQRINKDNLQSRIESCTSLDNTEKQLAFIKDSRTAIESHLRTCINSLNDDLSNLFENKADDLLLNEKLSVGINDNLRHYLDKHNMENMASVFSSVKFIDQNMAKIRETSIDRELQGNTNKYLEDEMNNLHSHYRGLLNHLSDAIMVIEARHEKLSCEFAYSDFINWLEKEEVSADSKDYGDNWSQCQNLYQDYNNTISGNIIATGASRLSSLNTKLDDLNLKQEKTLTDLKNKLILSQNTPEFISSLSKDYKWMIEFIENDQNDVINKQAFSKIKWTELVEKVQARKSSLQNALEVLSYARDIDELNCEIESKISEYYDLSNLRYKFIHQPDSLADTQSETLSHAYSDDLGHDNKSIERKLKTLENEIVNDLQPRIKTLQSARDRLCAIYPDAKTYVSSVWCEVDERWSTLSMGAKKSANDAKNYAIITDWFREAKKISDWLKIQKLSSINNDEIHLLSSETLPKNPNDADQLVTVFEIKKNSTKMHLNTWKNIEKKAIDVKKLDPEITEQVNQKVNEINYLWDDLEQDIDKKTLLYRKNADVRKLFADMDDLEAWLSEQELHTRENMLNWLGYQLEYETSERVSDAKNSNINDALDEHSQLIRKLKLMEERMKACQRLSQIEIDANSTNFNNLQYQANKQAKSDLLSERNIQKVKHQETIRLVRDQSSSNVFSLPKSSQDQTVKDTKLSQKEYVPSLRGVSKKASFSAKDRPFSIFMSDIPETDGEKLEDKSSQEQSRLKDIESVNGPAQVKYLTDNNGKKLANPKWMPSSSKQPYYWLLLCGHQLCIFKDKRTYTSGSIPEKTHNIHRAVVQIDKASNDESAVKDSITTKTSRHPYRLKVSTLDTNSTLKPLVMLLAFPTQSLLLDWYKAIRLNSNLSPDKQLMIPLELGSDTSDFSGPEPSGTSELVFLHKGDDKNYKKSSTETLDGLKEPSDLAKKNSTVSNSAKANTNLLPSIMSGSNTQPKKSSTSRFSLSRLANSLRKSPTHFPKDSNV